MYLYLLASVLLVRPAAGSIVADVRADVRKGELAKAEIRVEAYRQEHGINPQLIAAVSWLGRGALAAGQFDKAEAYAAQTRKLALEQLKSRALDADNDLPIALGASIEVQAHVMAERGERDQAVSFLQRELEAWRYTSIRTRIQKNINLLNLEGKPAPPLAAAEWLGPRSPPLEELKGRPVLLFLWAHWCGDCKRQAPVLAKLQERFGPQGLVIFGPTQRYGYVARGEEATPGEELKYIDQVRRRDYAEIRGMAVPVSEETFANYGASTTPTLVLIHRDGIVRMYHPGQMSYADLATRVEEVVAEATPHRSSRETSVPALSSP